MLEPNDSGRFDFLLSNTPFEVELPERMAGFWSETGYEPTTALEQRRRPRVRMRTKAILEILAHLPAFPRDFRLGGVFTRNLSATGLGFLFHRQLYPGERVRIHLPGRGLEGPVARCVRLARKCYDVGLVLENLRRELPASTAEAPGEKETPSVSVQDIFSQVSRSLSEVIEMTQAQIICHHLPRVHCDPERLTLLYRRVLEIALARCLDVTPVIEVGAELDFARQMWRCYVKDNGAARGRAAGDRPGTPTSQQSWAQCKQLVGELGGTAWDETPGRTGHVFGFTLPAQRSSRG